MLYVLTATDRGARHSTALGMFDSPEMANLAAAMLRTNRASLGQRDDAIAVHSLPPQPLGLLDALHREMHPRSAGSEAQEKSARFAA